MNISLKPRTREHVTMYWDRIQDEEISRWLPSGVESLDQALLLFEETLKEGASSYGRVVEYEGTYIGDVWCYGIDEQDEKMAMVSFVLFAKEWWGKGIAAPAIARFLEEVFGKFAIDKVGAFTYANNFRSIGVLKKLGFQEMEAFTEDGVDSLYFEKGKESLTCQKES
ncbi:GNAT family N-acetyltransferase [Gorillibacterium timonense]|uniref:GNAT family N-acetyltransferase n=1 Tax=Gorillibacterium timonense TaxID=1689269 RepID=UPI00071CAEC7|nr:GNAT family N-acetyltransferase [Gorillibacterium timonense]